MLDLFDRVSGYIAFIPVFAVAYHFTDSFILVAIIAIAFYLVSTFFAAFGIVIQFSAWILGAVFVVTDPYPPIIEVIYFVLLTLYIVRFIRVLSSNGKRERNSESHSADEQSKSFKVKTDDKISVVYEPINQIMNEANSMAKPYNIIDLLGPIINNNIWECREEVNGFDERDDLVSLGHTILYASTSQILKSEEWAKSDAVSKERLAKVFMLIIDNCLDHLIKAGIYPENDARSERSDLYRLAYPTQQSQNNGYVYATGYNGMTARVPADKLEEWKKHQDDLAAGRVEPDKKAADDFLDYIRKL